ncbi:hypothetical protein [Salegentibacter mishustinae]|uniref:hypothetical protein n=1 Tax=Salegentibacter mishustinae TaxID=270918 RepID=UPI003742F87D
MIYARITVNQKRVLISLKRKISIDIWDSEECERDILYAKNGHSIPPWPDQTEPL